MITRATVEISREPEAVYEFTTEHVPEWSRIVVSDETVEEKAGGVGTTFRVVTEERGRRMEFEGEVTKHEPPRAHSVLMKGSYFDMHVDYTFNDLGGRTEVTQVSRVDPKGGMKIFFGLFGWMMKRSGRDAAQKELENLKGVLESSADAK